MDAQLAHIFDGPSGLSTWWYVAAGAFLSLLIIEHYVVSGIRGKALRRHLHLGASMVVIAAILALTAPTSSAQIGLAQSPDALLPDLISDPPNPSFLNELRLEDGTSRLVITFDGFVHNIGDGPLDVVGNPQEPGGMRQRVRVGNQWEEVGAPTVRYETDDGHNHFHLIEAIEYVLWNEDVGSQSAIGSKIGFCLVDSEQIEPVTDQAYSEELDDFCQENNPDAESLRMGISAGWRDVYDATTTLQWVDISNVVPGRYWIGAITDPNDEIVESNEDNNALIFSDRTISVPGYAPRAMEPIDASGAQPIVLRSSAHGEVGAPVYVIEQGPTSGQLDVPIGVDLTSPEVTYFPEPGFAGTDQIVFSVRDGASPYPFTSPTETVVLNVAASEDDIDFEGTNLDPAVTAPSTFFETPRGEPVSVPITVSDAIGGPALFFARGLPAGLTADAETGIITGIPAEEGVFNVELFSFVNPNEVASIEVSWIVDPTSTDRILNSIADLSTPRHGLTRVQVANSLGLDLDAVGLPPGVTLQAESPSVAGAPTEVGVYSVTVRQMSNGDVVDETSFTWTVRPTVAIDFTL